VETESFAETEKITEKQIKNQNHIEVFFFFFYCRGIEHHEFATEGKTVNAAFYVEVLKRLRDRVRRVRQELWDHDNTPAHSALIL